VSEELEFSLAVGRFLVQQATVKLQNNEHDDREASVAAHPLSPRSLAGRFSHPQLPKIIIARLQEWKSGIVRSSRYADDLVAEAPRDYAQFRRVVDAKLLCRQNRNDRKAANVNFIVGWTRIRETSISDRLKLVLRKQALRKLQCCLRDPVGDRPSMLLRRSRLRAQASRSLRPRFAPRYV
jgi:hypothetical protein